jgi:hypothetical protein
MVDNKTVFNSTFNIYHSTLFARDKNLHSILWMIAGSFRYSGTNIALTKDSN